MSDVPRIYYAAKARGAGRWSKPQQRPGADGAAALASAKLRPKREQKALRLFVTATGAPLEEGAWAESAPPGRTVHLTALTDKKGAFDRPRMQRRNRPA